MSESTSDNKVQLGCGTLIVIALIVMFFSGGSDSRKVRGQLEEINKRLDRIEQRLPEPSAEAAAASPDATSLGYGFSPVTSSVFAFWQRFEPGPAGVLMVYFRGKPGWHSGAIDKPSGEGAFDRTITLTVNGVPLTLSVEGKIAVVQGVSVDLSKGNVLLVQNAAAPPGAAEIETLGTFNEDFAKGQNPANVVASALEISFN